MYLNCFFTSLDHGQMCLVYSGFAGGGSKQKRGLSFVQMVSLKERGSNFIVAMVSDKGKMAMNKMKLYLKSKATFGLDGQFTKAHLYLANCLHFWLNLLYQQVRFPDSVQPVISVNLFCSHFKFFVDLTWFDCIRNVWCVSNMLQINSFRAQILFFLS